MKEIDTILLSEQKKSSRKPIFDLSIAPYDHPDPSTVVQWSLFGLEQLDASESTPYPHCLAFTQTGRMIRFKTDGSVVWYKTILNPGPGSTFDGTWVNLGSSPSNSVIGLSATLEGPEVILFANFSNVLKYRRSEDNGSHFGSWTTITGSIVADRCLSACHKTANEMCVVFSDNTSKDLKIITRDDALTWSAVATLPSSPDIERVAVYFDGDYNIVALVNRSNILSLARIVYGQGYRVDEGTWSDVVYLGLASATIESSDLLNRQEETPSPGSYYEPARFEFDFESLLSSVFKISHKRGGAYNPEQEYKRGGIFGRDRFYYGWKNVPVLKDLPATDNLELNYPFITKPQYEPAIMSFIRSGERWFYRLRPGTDFYDADWNLACRQRISTVYGMSLACDASYVWAARANEVWRMPHPGLLQIPPTIGTGAGAGTSLTWGDILKTQETIKALSPGDLYIELEDSDKEYSSLIADNTIQRGKQVILKYGYQTATGNIFDEGNHIYYLEDWTYSRSANRASLILHCVDAWYLLERFKMPAPAEINQYMAEYSVFDICDRLVQCIGGTLAQGNASDYAVNTLPKMSIKAGQSAADIIRELLKLVPDVIIFDGLDGRMYYPQVTDEPVYTYYSTSRGAPAGDNHYLWTANYRSLSKLSNHVYIIGRDSVGDPVYGSDVGTTERGLVGERLDFRLMPQLGTVDECTAAAQSVQAEQRLNTSQCVVSSPPNLGIELYDVVRVYDSLFPSSDYLDYRVIGIDTRFNALSNSFIQKLYLCGV